jgi:acetyl-CoA synthetase
LLRWSFKELDEQSTCLADSLSRVGVRVGEPVGVHLGQGPETALAHLALYKCGAIVCTMSELYGPDTLRHILRDTQLKVLITRGDSAALDGALSTDGPAVRVIKTDGSGSEFWSLVRNGNASFKPVATTASSPALLMYTSGSTGHPKGMLHAHRVLSAYMPTVRLFYDLSMDAPGAVFWAPADWAWVGGLLDLVLPAWVHGQTVVSWNGRFEPERCFKLMERHKVTHSFMTPTALKRLAEVEHPRRRWELSLRYVCSGGESLPGEVVRWRDLPGAPWIHGKGLPRP